jgi:hypothetical protein
MRKKENRQRELRRKGKEAEEGNIKTVQYTI